MKELIKINNKWVKPSNWKAAVISYPSAEKGKKVEVKGKEVEVKRCKSYNEIVDTFEGDEPRPEVYRLSKKWQNKVTMSEDLKELRFILGWPLYQEWIKETITGH